MRELMRGKKLPEWMPMEIQLWNFEVVGMLGALRALFRFGAR